MDIAIEIAKHLAFRHKLAAKLVCRRLYKLVEIYDIDEWIEDTRMFDLFPELRVVKVNYSKVYPRPSICCAIELTRDERTLIKDNRKYEKVVMFEAKYRELGRFGRVYEQNFFKGKFNKDCIKHIIMHEYFGHLDLNDMKEYLMNVKSIKLDGYRYFPKRTDMKTSAQYLLTNLNLTTDNYHTANDYYIEGDICDTKLHDLKICEKLDIIDNINKIKPNALRIFIFNEQYSQIGKLKYEHRLALLEVRELINIPELKYDPHTLVFHCLSKGDVIPINPIILYIGNLKMKTVNTFIKNIRKMTNLRYIYFDDSIYDHNLYNNIRDYDAETYYDKQERDFFKNIVKSVNANIKVKFIEFLW